MSELKKISLTKQKILDLWGVFMDLEHSKQPLNQHFSYAMGINEDAIEPHVKAFEKVARKDEAYQKYDEDRVNLILDMAIKDNDGNPIKNNDGGYEIRSQPEFDRALLDLQKS